MPGEPRAVLDAYFDGINEERYDDVGALFAPDGALVAPGVTPRRGPAEIARYFTAALAPYPVHRDDPTRSVLAGATATVEIAFTGALASGAPMAFDAIDVFDFDADGRIARLSTWYDSHLVRGRLAEAQAVSAPGAADRARLGSFAEATAARVRVALRDVRRGHSIPLGAAARWRRLPAAPGPLAARAVLHGGAVEPRSGDVLLVRTGAPAAPLSELPDVPLAAVALDGRLEGDAPVGLTVGEGFALEDVAALPHAAGLLVSVPDGDGRANAAIWS